MAPPYKKQRTMPHIDDDTANPELVTTKNSVCARLQEKFAEMQAKYEKIPESMTDEIDMKTGQILVDRGHMRKWNRDYVKKQGNRTDLVDDLFLNEAADSGEEGNNDEDDDGRDELAPSEPPESRTSNQGAKDIREALAASNMPGTLLPLREQPPSTPAGAVGASGAQALVSNAPGPTADWMQMIKALQTPVEQHAQGNLTLQQQAQTFFMEQFQQAFTPIVSLLSTFVLPQANANPALLNPAAARIPNPLFPPPALQSISPPQASDDRTALPSNPLPVAASCPRRERTIAKGVYVRSRRRRSLPNSQHDKLPISGQQKEEFTLEEERNSDDDVQVEVAEKTPRQKEDGKVTLGHTVATEAGAHTLKAIEKKRRPRKIKGSINTTESYDLRKISPPLSPHLPTPSSLEHEEPKSLDDHPQETLTDNVEDLVASGGHFDDEERDLLSLHEDDDSEMIWPSIETEPLADLDTASNHPSTMPIKDKTTSEVNEQRPVIQDVFQGKMGTFQAHTDSEGDLGLQADSPSTASLPNLGTASKPKCRRPRIYHYVEHSLPEPNLPPTTSNDRKLPPPVTPRVKRESLTPNLLATPALHTPLSAPQPTALTSSDAKPRPTPLPRSAYLQKVKQAWAKGRNKSIFSPRSLAKAKSLQSLKKRAREVEDEGISADELEF